MCEGVLTTVAEIALWHNNTVLFISVCVCVCVLSGIKYPNIFTLSLPVNHTLLETHTAQLTKKHLARIFMTVWTFESRNDCYWYTPRVWWADIQQGAPWALIIILSKPTWVVPLGLRALWLILALAGISTGCTCILLYCSFFWVIKSSFLNVKFCKCMVRRMREILWATAVIIYTGLIESSHNQSSCTGITKYLVCLGFQVLHFH